MEKLYALYDFKSETDEELTIYTGEELTSVESNVLDIRMT